jgi:hypothetical protein
MLTAMFVPRVSFVVPTYNYGRFVGQAIESLLTQTFFALEIIVIDDGSTDDTAAVIGRYRDPRVRLICHDRNQGHIRTYNEGLTLARGEFVGLLSADDLCLRTDAVSRQVEMLDRDPHAGFVYSALTFIDEKSSVLNVYSRWPQDGFHDGFDEFKLLVLSNHVPASGPLVRASCHRELGYYDERLPHAGDWDLWLRLSARYRVAYIAEPLYGYRQHGVNMHQAAVTPEVADDDHLRVLHNAFDGLPASAPAEVRALRRPALLRIAVRAIDQERRWGRVGTAWRRAWNAIRFHPSVITDHGFLVATTKLAIRTMLGPVVVMKVLAFRRRSSVLPARAIQGKSE